MKVKLKKYQVKIDRNVQNGSDLVANIRFDVLYLNYRPSPKKDHKSINKTKTAGSTSFQDFQASVSDAWDIDDDEFCIISGVESKLRLIRTIAQQIIGEFIRSLHIELFGFIKEYGRLFSFIVFDETTRN